MFPPCSLAWDQTKVEVIKIMVTSFKRSCACSTALSGPDPAAGHRWPMPLLETPGHSRVSLGQSLVASLLPSPGTWCAQSFVYALQVSVSRVLCKFWRLSVGVNGDLLQECLCRTQVCSTQSPCPWQATADLYLCRRHSNTQSHVWFSLCGVSLAHKVLFEPSEHLW